MLGLDPETRASSAVSAMAGVTGESSGCASYAVADAPHEVARRAGLAVRRHAINADEARELLEMLGLHPDSPCAAVGATDGTTDESPPPCDTS